MFRRHIHSGTGSQFYATESKRILQNVISNIIKSRYVEKVERKKKKKKTRRQIIIIIILRVDIQAVSILSSTLASNKSRSTITFHRVEHNFRTSSYNTRIFPVAAVCRRYTRIYKIYIYYHHCVRTWPCT